MLKILKIQDLILIESTEINFLSGLNIITGETGSGKSAVLEALALVLGSRADSQMIRSGAKKAIVEAEFDISFCPLINELLIDQEIDFDEEEFLKIRRELGQNGKNRCFVNYQLVQSSFLKEIGKYLVNMVSQHANQQLLESLTHRDFLDSYAGLKNEVRTLSDLWEKKSKLQRKIQNLKDNESFRLREKDRYLMELDELAEANIKSGEEEVLFAEYQKLSKCEEISGKLQELLQFFAEGRSPFLPLLYRNKAQLNQLAEIDPHLNDASETLNHLYAEFEELSYVLSNYASKVEHQPTKLAKINERLAILHRIKRKYGEDWPNYQKGLNEKITELEQTDIFLAEWEKELEHLNQKYIEESSQISFKRQNASQLFEKEVLEHLRNLNMEKAQFQVDISQIHPGPKGIDHIQFMLAPNWGESFFAVQECASGGELARLMLAIKSVIADKEHYPTIVFDEIDANLGGETATIVGEKLHTIGQNRQVICITHLPQVALKAHHHLKIYKEEKNGRTITQIISLDPFSRQTEIARMLGGNSVLKECQIA